MSPVERGAVSTCNPTLRTGDIIATGMPHGPGDEIYLKTGDIVEGEVSGLGVLRNPVVAES